MFYYSLSSIFTSYRLDFSCDRISPERFRSLLASSSEKKVFLLAYVLLVLIGFLDDKKYLLVIQKYKSIFNDGEILYINNFK